MTAKVSDVFFVKRRGSGSNMVPQMVRVENGSRVNSEPMISTMRISLSPLLTTMKVFGLYFKRGTNDGEQALDKKSRCRCNLGMIYATVVVVLMWLDVVRMFSVFSPQDTFGPVVFFKFNACCMEIHYVITLP